MISSLRLQLIVRRRFLAIIETIVARKESSQEFEELLFVASRMLEARTDIHHALTYLLREMFIQLSEEEVVARFEH